MKPSSVLVGPLVGLAQVLVVLLLVQPVVGAAQAAGGGVLTGQVSNAATGGYLKAATVTIKGTSRVAVTDREGRYRFTGLPAGLWQAGFSLVF